MTIEFIGSSVQAGLIQAAGRRPWAEAMVGLADTQPDADFPFRAAALDEEAGFGKILVGYHPSAPDGLVLGNGILTTTSRIGVVIAHVPGLVAPVVAARQFATLAAFHPGRVAIHAVTEPDASIGLRDGDTSQPAVRSERTAEFLQVVRQMWEAKEPFDHSGPFYRVDGASSAVSSAGQGLPIYCSGESQVAVRAVAAHADGYLFGVAPPAVIARRIARIRAITRTQGRSPRFGVSLRLIAAPTERAARDRRRAVGQAEPAAPAGVAPWMPPANVGRASGLLPVTGSYDQVAETLLHYVAVGISSLVIEHDPVIDAADCAAVIARVSEQRFSGVARRPGPGSACRSSAAACLRPGSRA